VVCKDRALHSVTFLPNSILTARGATCPEALGTESQRYNGFIIRRGNAAQLACPEVEGWQPHHWTT